MPGIQSIIDGGDADANNQLVDACKAKLNDEGLAFLWAIKHYRSLATPGPTIAIPVRVIGIGGMVPPEHHGSQNSIGRWVYETFIPDGDRQINISGPCRNKLDAAYASNSLAPASFDDAYADIMRIMNNAMA